MTDKPEPEQIQEEFNAAVKAFQAQERVRDAAPDLLKALQGVLPFMEEAERQTLVGNEGCLRPVEAVRCAISKAID